MTDSGLLLYAVCRKHGLTLGEFHALHPAERRFFVRGYREYADRIESETPNI